MPPSQSPTLCTEGDTHKHTHTRVPQALLGATAGRKQSMPLTHDEARRHECRDHLRLRRPAQVRQGTQEPDLHTRAAWRSERVLRAGAGEGGGDSMCTGAPGSAGARGLGPPKNPTSSVTTSPSAAAARGFPSPHPPPAASRMGWPNLHS